MPEVSEETWADRLRGGTYDIWGPWIIGGSWEFSSWGPFVLQTAEQFPCTPALRAGARGDAVVPGQNISKSLLRSPILPPPEGW